jgi:GGDEF domain-containing protein
MKPELHQGQVCSGKTPCLACPEPLVKNPEPDHAVYRTLLESTRAIPIFKEQIPHAASAVGQLLTVSQGVGTIIPSTSDTLIQFIDAVDRRLYRAKQGGRDRSVA